MSDYSKVPQETLEESDDDGSSEPTCTSTDDDDDESNELLAFLEDQTQLLKTHFPLSSAKSRKNMAILVWEEMNEEDE